MESSSSKKAKGFHNNHHYVSCLVDGCNSDLSQSREYHRRHKVCELHSKTPKVTIGGREQRFCQQCSRFHSLGEFDNGKRSCRKRLDGHNRRRRKPQTESPSKSPTRFLPRQQGSTLLSFSNTTPQPLPSAMVDSSWAGRLKLDQTNAAGPYYCSNDNTIGSLTCHHSFGRVGNQFKIMSGSDYPIPEPLFLKQAAGTNFDSDCALSLLSSVTTAETQGIGLGHNATPRMQYCEEPMSSCDAHDNLQCQAFGFFLHGPNGPSSGGPDPTPSFKWE